MRKAAKAQAAPWCRYRGGSAMIGKVYEINDPKNEPVLECVAEEDKKRQKVADDRLISFVERIERLNEEKKGINDDIAAVFAEAKSVGYDVKAIRECIKLRKMNQADRDEQDYIIDTYRLALGI